MFSLLESGKMGFRFLFLLLAFFFCIDMRLNGTTLVSPCQDELPIGLISIGKLKEDLKHYLKNSKRESEPEIQRAALFNLCQLHIWIGYDPRYAQSETLQGIRATAATRLRTWTSDYRLNQKRQNRKLKPGQNSDVREATNENNSNRSGLYASDSQSESEMLARLQGYESTSFAMGTASGGPSQMLNYLYGSSGPPWDHAEDLIALIEDTINPDSWRKNGGTASIHYHRPQLALVVTATQEVHDRIYQLLWQLRAMN